MAHAALTTGATKWGPGLYAIRSSMWRRLCAGEAVPRSLFDDEKLQLKGLPTCEYCGGREHMSVDHLIPISRGGGGEGENLVRACRSCNSSKNDRDLMQWYLERGAFPPLLVLRRYLKICMKLTRERGLWDRSLDALEEGALPFLVETLPVVFPPPDMLRMQV